MADIRQNADGSLGIYSDSEGVDLLRAGGGKSPTQSTPNYRPGSTMKFAVAGTADTGGALMSWQNTLGYDLLLDYAMLDVTTQSSAACTVSIGQTSTNGTTLSSNLISGQSVAAAGQFNSGNKSVKCKQNEWITASTASGASAGLVGNLYVSFLPA